VRKEEMLPFMDGFCDYVCEFARSKGGYLLSHANFFMSGLVSLRLKECLRIPYVVTFHALGRVRRLHQREADQFPARRMDIEDDTIALADGIVAECPQDHRDLTQLYRADERRIAVIPCGFARDEFWPIAKPFARRALGFAPHEPLLVNVGRLAPRKGLLESLGALRLARSRGVAARLVVAGSGPEEPRLREHVRESGLTRDVSFVGPAYGEAKARLLAQAEVLLLPSYSEGLPYALLEGMAAGAVPIVTPVGAIPDVVIEGLHGVVVPPRDAGAIASALARLAGDRPSLTRMSAACRRRIADAYSIDRLAVELGELYQELCPCAASQAG